MSRQNAEEKNNAIMTFMEENTLVNGLHLTFHDNSRPLAGDRWLVELCCTAAYPLPEPWRDELEEPDAELRAAMLERLGDKLEFNLGRSRHFVDEREKEEVLAELLAGLKEHLLVYFVKPEFPRRLFADTCRKLHEECRLARQQARLMVEEVEEDEDDEDGPADFSALFRSSSSG